MSINWKTFGAIIGFLSFIFLIGAYLAGNMAGENSLGYTISHNIYVWIFVFVMLGVGIFCCFDTDNNKMIKEDKKIKCQR